MSETQKKLLIVEDELDLAEMYKIKFEKEWYDVHSVSDGFKALVDVQNFRPDVILLDIMMPDIDWFETLHIIREQTSLKTKIFIVSNLNNSDDINKALVMWADWYFIKASMTPQEVFDKVSKSLKW